MPKIKKKIKTEYFSEIASGKRTFELYLNDLNLVEGDVLVLQEFDGNNQLTGREIKKTVKYIQKINLDTLPWPPDEIADEGLQIIAFE